MSEPAPSCLWRTMTLSRCFGIASPRLGAHIRFQPKARAFSKWPYLSESLPKGVISHSEQSPSKQTRLAAAAEALVDAVSLEVDAATKKNLVGGLDALKSSLDENLNRVVQKMQSSNEDFDAKINSLSQHVDGAKAEVSAIRNDVATIKSLLEEDRKQKILTRAFESIDILLKHREVPHDCHSTAGSFNFISHDGLFNRTYKSSELAKEVLLSFMQSRGYYLPKNHALKLS